MMRPRMVKMAALVLLLIVAVGGVLGIDVIAGGLITDSFKSDSQCNKTLPKLDPPVVGY